MLGVFAEFETNLRRERQLEGIAKAKKAGVYKGRPPSIDAATVQRLRAAGKGASLGGPPGPPGLAGSGLPRLMSARLQPDQ
jgi:DNA invertase Pin-like site-specific DNA recombinase